MKASERTCQRCRRVFDIDNDLKRRDMTYPLCAKCQPACETCGDIGESGDRRCANCWEVESRIRRYLQSYNGRAYVEALLRNGE